ncbi:M20 family metallopeptidase [Enterobacillus tribolii]|uniref:Glutamate carboxypeptidase n=1 Tax=Enterobacillus tribolii TaxID=1487935 RepID=A0A370QNT4_9GAMM|nr:M20 family metallopeptidase [Enterobacillus tribolii]MBW7981936.1 M20 family peptidase [Enterobacillus tribolii]RDK90045.1 glutamate carboxypeptidase [Enterobacillus tribolii]
MDVEQYLCELRKLVNIDSDTHNPAGVNAVAGMVAALFDHAGWYCSDIDLSAQTGKGLLISSHPTGQDFDLLLLGHLDTVFPEGTARARPFHVCDGRAYGPGVADMKGGLLSMFWALHTLDAAHRKRLRIAVALNPDEEINSVYSRDWLSGLARNSGCVLVGEAARPDGALINARKGMARYRLNFQGVSAHAGNAPQNGRSAINALAGCIQEINQLCDAQNDTTLNFGSVWGGGAPNVIADQAGTLLEIRFWRNEEYQRVNQALEARCRQPFAPGVTTRLTQEVYMPAMTPSPDTHRLMQLVERAGRAVNQEIRWRETGAVSDANHSAATGTPTLDGFGPIGAGFHSQGEFLEIASVEPRVRLLQNVIAGL